MINRLIENVLYRIYRGIEFRKEVFEKRYYNNRQLNDKYLKNKKFEVNGQYEIKFPIAFQIGNGCTLGRKIYFDCRGGLIIGENTKIGDNVSIITVNKYSLAGVPLDEEKKILPGNVIIGKNVWVQNNATILPGVRVGDGSIIHSNVVVSSNVPENTIVYPNNKQILNHNKNFFSEKSYKEISILQKQNKFNEGYQIVFVLSTGRSGSNSIAVSLNQHPSINAYHEPFYTQLKILSINYSTGRISRERVKTELLEIYSNVKNSSKGKIYIESDQKLIVLFDVINEIFPQAKYIWLIRDPRKFLQSASARGWFENDDPEFREESVLIQENFASDAVRVTGFLQGIDYGIWRKMSQEDKILWYWKFWNNEIEKAFNILPMDRKLFMNLDNLNNSEDKIFDFLNLNKTSQNIFEVKNRMKHKHLKNFKSYSNEYFQDKFENYTDVFEKYLKLYSKNY